MVNSPFFRYNDFMSKKKSNVFFIILLILFLLVVAYFYFTLSDEEIESILHPENSQEPQATEQTVTENSTQTQKENEITETAAVTADGNLYIKNLELPRCKKGALLITEKNTHGVLDTPEKEDSHQIIYHNGFTLCYREKYEQPEWVCYTLDKTKATKNVDRKDNFRSDPLVLTGSAELADYKGTGYDRGHLAPSADLTYSAETMDESFVLSNMSPQAAKFNRGMWKDLEAQVRDFTKNFDMLYIITGPILEKDEYPVVGKNDVAVPEYYYKAVLGIKNDKYYMIGFILPNEDLKGSYWDYAVCVDEIEKRCDVDFFSLLSDDIENKLEKSLNIDDWK